MPRRSLLTMIILSIITLGFYQIYWTYKTRQELVGQKQDVPPFKLLMAPILAILAVGLVTLIVHLATNQSDSGGSNVVVNVLAVIVGILAVLTIIPISLYWFYKYCKAVEGVTEGDLTFGMSYALFIVGAIFNVSFL